MRLNTLPWTCVALAAATALLHAPPAAASGGYRHVSAAVCDAVSPQGPTPSRNWGVSNPTGVSMTISCPVPQGPNMVQAYIVHGSAYAGSSIVCQMRHLKKEDGSLQALYSFTITGTQSVDLSVKGAASNDSGVGELICTLPPYNRGRLHGIESWG